MKIAAYTKQTLANSPVKNGILTALKATGEFEVTECLRISDMPSDCRKLLVFGGDGTMLESAVAAAGSGIPVLGINLGNMGFLTELEADSAIEDIVSSLKSADTVSRMLLECVTDGKRVLALNDIVVKGATARPIRISLEIDGDFVDSYHSDGLIIATPTGSTAYSLSAGGPAVAPDVKAIVVNPVCPHSLHSRPLVVGENAALKITLAQGDDAELIADGKTFAQITGGQSLSVGKSGLCAVFAAAGKSGFYSKLLKKMNRWGVTQ